MPQAVVATIHAVKDLRQALAAARLRAWARARQQLKAGHRPMIAPPRGRATHKNTETMADAALVMCIDFERALATLESKEQTLLVLRYRDGIGQTEVARMLGMSARWVSYTEDTALAKLADALAIEELL